MNAKRPTPKHIIIKMPKIRDNKRMFKAAREKQLVTCKGAPKRMSTDFSTDTLQARRDWNKISKEMKSLQLRVLLTFKSII